MTWWTSPSGESLGDDVLGLALPLLTCLHNTDHP